MSIGDNLRKFRIRNNQSQQEVADFLEIDRRTYINWENKKCDVKSEHIPKLAECFNIEIIELFDSTKGITKKKSENDIIIITTNKINTTKLMTIIKDNL